MSTREAFWQEILPACIHGRISFVKIKQATTCTVQQPVSTNSLLVPTGEAILARNVSMHTECLISLERFNQVGSSQITFCLVV